MQYRYVWSETVRSMETQSDFQPPGLPVHVRAFGSMAGSLETPAILSCKNYPLMSGHELDDDELQ